MPGARARILLAGAGHAHLYTLARTAELTASGFDVSLVSRSPYLYYSGMATGGLSGRYSPREGRIDARRLVESGGGRFVEGRVERVVPKERTLLLEGGEALSYDAASFAVGSETPGGDDPAVVPVKPVENLARLREALLKASELVVIGAGAAGCEVAVNAAAIGGVTLVGDGPEPLPLAPKRARDRMLGALRERGVRTLFGRRAVSISGDGVSLDDGTSLRGGVVALAVGVRPSDLFARSGLATAEDGGLWVDHYLRSVSDGALFGGGDCVSFRGDPLPRFGVHAVRQGSTLFRNLRASLEGAPLKTYRPRKTHLYILDLGDGTGLGVYGAFSWRGVSAMRLKERIDRAFIERYEVFGP